jgi:hypothetical protein
MTTTFTRDWALRWVEGSILSYVRGGINLNILLGRIRSATTTYGVGRDEVLAIVGVIKDSPVYLPSLSKDEKISRLAPLIEALRMWPRKGEA